MLQFVFLILSQVLVPAFAQAADGSVGQCVQERLENLRRVDPSGYQNYVELQNKQDFEIYLGCPNGALFGALVTAVHESTHLLDIYGGSYSLISGEKLQAPPELSRFFPPSRIAGGLDRNDSYVKVYLLGHVDSKSSFFFLLEELNGHTRGVNTAGKLAYLRDRDSRYSGRDGIAALMLFIKLYIDQASRSEPATWEGLNHPEVRKTVLTLWAQAERVLLETCPMKTLGMKDGSYLREVYKRDSAFRTLSSYLGEQLAKPRTCR